MPHLTYEKEITGLVVIDPYNDFISEGGKIWDRIKTLPRRMSASSYVAGSEAARKTGMRVFYAMHRRYRPGDYETWKYIAPIQKAAWSRKTFEYGTWGGEFRAEFEPHPGDIVAAEHWCSSGFANTDLDLQLKKHGIQQTHRRRTDRAHLCRGHRSLCRRTRLRRHGGEGRDRGLLRGVHARRTRSQSPKLRQRGCHNTGSH
jgi:hypothetical protein